MPYPPKVPNPLYLQFQDARDLISYVADGALVVAGIGGPPGLGKSHLAEQVLIERGFKQWCEGEEATAKSYYKFVGTRAALAHMAYVFRVGGIIILDDADSLLLQGGRVHAELMKQLLDTTLVRHVMHHSERARENDARPLGKQKSITPSAFETRARFIICSNEDFGNVSETMRPHLDALKSRGLRLIRLSPDPRHHLDYALDLICDQDLLRTVPQPYSLHVTQDVIDWLCERAYWLTPGVSPRIALEAAKMRRLDPEGWRRKMESEIRAAPVLPDSELPSRRVYVPVTQRPEYVPPLANAKTQDRKRQRVAAMHPNHQQRKETQDFVRAITLTVDRLSED